MKILNVNTVIISAVLVGAVQSTLVHSVEPMSESAMGNISAESGDVLNVMGSSASGDEESASTSELQFEKSNEQALSSANYIELDPSIEPRANASLTPSSIDMKDSVSTLKISERSNGQMGNATLSYDEKANLTSSSYNGSALTINQNVKIQQVQIEQVRHSAGGSVRGDYTFGDIQVNGAVSISER
jgi:hypothetical protein